MAFWSGFAKGLQEYNVRETEDRRIEEDRKFQKDFFWEKFNAESSQRMRELLLQSGGTGGTRRGSGGAKDSSGMSIEALATKFPGISEETLAELAPYPDKIEEVYNSLSGLREEYAGARRAWLPEMEDQFIMDILPSGDEDLSEERIQSVAKMYGVDPTEEIYSGSGVTWGDQISRQLQGDRTADVVLNEAAIPAPIKPEAEKLYRSTVEGRVKGYLQNQIDIANREFGTATDIGRRAGQRGEAETPSNAEDMILRRQQLETLKKQVEDGYTDEALSTEFGTKILQEIWESGNQVDYREMYPQFSPVYGDVTSPEVQAQIQSAIDSGFLRRGQRIKVIEGGVLKTKEIE